MTIKEFRLRFYNPIANKCNGKSFEQISEKDKMILAMGECEIAIDNNQYNKFCEIQKDIAEIDKEEVVLLSKMELVERISAFYKIDKETLLINIKTMFAKV